MSRGIAVAACALVVALFCGSASASDGTSPRLDGDFRIVGKIGRANDGNAGNVIHRVWSFRSPCGQGACDRVKLIRRTQNGSRAPSWLRLVSPGAYRGVEHNRMAECSESPGVARAPIRVVVTQSDGGLATTINGTGSYRLKCPGTTGLFESITFRGSLKP